MEPKETAERIVLASLAISSFSPINRNFFDVNPKPQIAQLSQQELSFNHEDKDLIEAPYTFLEKMPVLKLLTLKILTLRGCLNTPYSLSRIFRRKISLKQQRIPLCILSL